MISLTYLTDPERLNLTPALDEYIFTKDTRILYYGDGETPGGRSVVEDELVKLLTNIKNKNNDIKINYDKISQRITVDTSSLISNLDNRLNLITAIGNHLFLGHLSTPLNDATIYANTINVLANNISNDWKNSAALNFNLARGSTTFLNNVQLNDRLASIKFNTYTNGEYITNAFIGAKIYDNALGTNTFPSVIEICVKGNSPIPESDGFYQYFFQPNGAFKTRIVELDSNDEFVNLPTPSKAGMIVFDANTKHFLGFNGSEWKQLDN